jgi:uncharacterized membrane protein
VRSAEDATAREGGAKRAGLPPRLLQLAGGLGLLGVVASAFLLAAGAAGAPNMYVPARSGGWPGWLAGPLSGLDLTLPGHRFQTLMLVMCGGYALVLASARALSARSLAATIVLAHVVLALGPPLISQDVFGYVAYARMGVLHGLDPYTHFPSEAPADAVFPFLGWPFQHSPYGPLFTLASYPLAPLGLPASVWVLKALAAATSLAAIALIARTAARMGHSARWAAAFVGLNPVVLALAVGGAHNDTLILLAFATVLALTAAAPPHGRAAAATLAAGIGVKVSAAVLLPFLVLSEPSKRARLSLAATAALTLVALAALGLVGFGVHTVGFLNAVGEQQQLVATHSIPAETARLFGVGTPAHPPTWWRHLFLGLFVLALLVALWRTLRGADWRVCGGWAIVALLLCTSWLLPWYAIWPLPLAAVGGDRRLRAAALVLSAYAVLIHLSLANGLLAPRPSHVPHHLPFPVPGVVHRLELSGFEVLRDVQRDFRW